MIQDTEVTVLYRGDNTQTSFSFPFPYRDADDIHGYIVDETGDETEITSNYRYDTTENKYIYPVQGTPLTPSQRIRLLRETPLQNNVDLPDKLPFSGIEKGMDWIVMMLQETIYRENIGQISVQEAIKQASLALTYAYKAEDEAIQAGKEVERATAEATEAAKQADIATERATQAGNYSAISFAATAKAWSASSAYSYPDVVAYTDGNTYRCIGTSVTGEVPTSSPYWVKITLDGENFFEIDEVGNLMPCISPTYSSRWELDSNGNIMPKEVI